MRKRFILISLAGIFVLMAQAQQKVGYADTEYIMSLMPEAKQMEEKLRTTQIDMEKAYKIKQQQFQQYYTEYTTNVKTMPDTTRKHAESKLQSMRQELLQFPQEAENTLQNTRRLWLAPAYLKIGKAINEVAVENGFSIILPRKINGINFLMHADENMNVSNFVLKKLGIAPENREKK